MEGARGVEEKEIGGETEEVGAADEKRRRRRRGEEGGKGGKQREEGGARERTRVCGLEVIKSEGETERYGGREGRGLK